MRLLHAGHDHPRLPAVAGEPEPERGGNPPGDLGEFVPMYRLSDDRQGDPRRRGADEQCEGGRGMTTETPSAQERTQKLEGLGTTAQARRGCPLYAGQG